MTDRELFDLAVKAMDNAYVPYSHFRVGAALLSEDGRVFTGRQAVGLKLVDQLGDEKTAVAWLVAQKKIKADLPVRDYKLSPRLGDMTFLRTAAVVTLEAVGLPSIAHKIADGGMLQSVDQYGLDGILALWRPSASN